MTASDDETTSGTPVTLLWLEATKVGTAARTHMDGTRTRLAEAGIPVAAEYTSDGGEGGTVSRLRRLFGLVAAARGAAHDGVLIARWHPFVAFVAGRWLRKGGRVLLLVQGNDASAYEANPWLRKVPGIERLMRRSLSRASRVLTVNRGLAEWVRAESDLPADVPVDVMPSGVADVFFDAQPVADAGEYVLFFGGLAPWQGIDYLLAAEASPEWPAAVRLLVIGDGAMADAVDAAQSDRLQWLGPLPPAEVASYVAGSLATLCPKSNTGSMATTTTPFKILESVAAGIPVIATDIPAQADMLADGYGLLVSVDEPADLARAVAGLHERPEDRARLAERARAVAPTYRWASAAPQLAEAVRSLQAPRRR